MPALVPDSCIQFGRTTVLPAERKVLLGNDPVRVGARAFDLLCTLINHRGEVVGKKQLIESVWPGVVVEENNLEVQICALRKLLGARTIVTVPGRGYAFTPDVKRLEADQAPIETPRPAKAGRGRAAALTPLRGRDAELATLRRLVSDHRLISIVGMGGVGKTRLARALHEDLDSPFTDGVHVVDLSALKAGISAARAVAAVLDLGLPERCTAEQLGRALASRTLLVVLENCEVALDAVAHLSRVVLDEAPRVRLLLTSQAPLKMRGEYQLRLAPLEVPAGDDPDAALASPAVLLLADTVSALQPRNSFARHEIHDAAAVCRHLDGLPLALELAGARVPMLGLAGVKRMLADRFRFLSMAGRDDVPRHRSLLACMQWSWRLLSDEERAALAALARFQGRFTVRMARRSLQPVCAFEWQATDMLGALVDKSLVVAEASHRSAFRLLETTRMFVQHNRAPASPLSG
jgi:predicted ATPase/DNA-binding winged helix-turn-helix (wHTH) protein